MTFKKFTKKTVKKHLKNILKTFLKKKHLKNILKKHLMYTAVLRPSSTAYCVAGRKSDQESIPKYNLTETNIEEALRLGAADLSEIDIEEHLNIVKKEKS